MKAISVTVVILTLLFSAGAEAATPRSGGTESLCVRAVLKDGLDAQNTVYTFSLRGQNLLEIDIRASSNAHVVAQETEAPDLIRVADGGTSY